MKKFLLSLLLTASAAVQADAIKVELIVFENLDPAAMQAEFWPANPGVPSLVNAIELPSPGEAAAGEKSWRLLPASQLALGGMVQRLRSSAGYRPLLHVGWVQPMDNSDRSPAAHVFSGMAASGDAKSSSQIDGAVAIRRGRFLHGDVDLSFRKIGAAGPVTVRLTTSRRLRSNEVHYLDHPLFGVILSVAPVQDAPSATGSRVQ